MLQVWTSGSNWWGLAAWHAPKLSNEHIDASLMSRTTSEAKPTPITTETVKPSFPLVVKILETKKQDWNLSKTDYVKINGKQFDLGMGNDRGGFGIAAAGWHLIGATKVSIKIKFSGIGRINDAHTFAGLIVDYRIGEKYTKRVSFNGMQVSKARTLNMPDWGRSAPPDLNVQLKEESYYEFDLQKWAPEGWRGETWVSMLLQNSGRNTMLQGEIQFEADR